MKAKFEINRVIKQGGKNHAILSTNRSSPREREREDFPSAFVLVLENVYGIFINIFISQSAVVGKVSTVKDAKFVSLKINKKNKNLSV